MSHRVIQVDSKVSSKNQADHLQEDIENKLDFKGYDLHTREVNDGSDIEGNPTLAVKTDHNNDSQANEFYNWLWNWAQSNQATYNTDGSVDTQGFEMLRIQVHDCKHLESKTERESDLHEKIVNSYPELTFEDVENMFLEHNFEGTDFGKSCEIGNANKFDLR